MVRTLTDVLTDPGLVGQQLEANLYGVTVDASRCTKLGVVLDITFASPPEFAAEGYGAECARVTVRPNGDLHAFPLGPPRRWLHRNTSPLGTAFGYLGGDLCLWYPLDPRGLRWDWSDGLEEYVTRVHRHLFFEEFWRRNDQWPVEDAPHGTPADGAHPVLSRLMRQASRR